MSRIGVTSSENTLCVGTASFGKAAPRAERGSLRRRTKKAPVRTYRGRNAMQENERRLYDADFHTTFTLPKRFSTALRLRLSLSCSTGQGALVSRTSSSASSFRTKAAEVTA